ncbi:MAG TPA: hypothetical protein VGJ09_16300 [Bryobacteraceae bacterium]
MGFYLAAAGLVIAQINQPSRQIQVATELLQQGRYADAQKQFQDALKICEAPQCVELPAILNGLGSLF